MFHWRIVTKTRIAHHVVQTCRSACFKICCAIHKSTNTCRLSCAGAHDARFQRDNQCAVAQTPTVQQRTGITKRENFRMSSGVVAGFALVMTTRNDLTISQHHRTNWNIAIGSGKFCFLKRNSHGVFVSHGHNLHSSGGRGGIRTHGSFHFTRFPSVPIRPLSHSSVREHCYSHE